ncbi:Asp23/Gls24 family envelope stress response protein [Pseudonocardia aurantiaca]|uniref:Asp23/Gls24 family envelope stress response protein n=1 Tax=Pseudonocardia aurantiaca TaxID=75290 RepID=A0ABW4FXD8_9PSEU
MTTPSGIPAASGAADSNRPQTVRNEATAPTRSPATAAGRGSDLETSQGRTTIAETVVSKIAGMATREIDGVAGFGGGAARAMGAVRERIPGARASSSQGVAVEVGERQAAVDLTIVVEYGVAIVELARAIRRNVIASIEQMTGLEVVEVNVSVVDLQLPGEDTGEVQPRQPGRVE